MMQQKINWYDSFVMQYGGPFVCRLLVPETTGYHDNPNSAALHPGPASWRGRICGGGGISYRTTSLWGRISYSPDRDPQNYYNYIYDTQFNSGLFRPEWLPRDRNRRSS